mgnify:CR=1 FL=1
MVNKKKYNDVFLEIFAIEEAQLEGLEYNAIQQWDSVGHMGLMTALEEVFDIMLDMDEIISFNSYKKGLEIIAKHNIQM